MVDAVTRQIQKLIHCYFSPSIAQVDYLETLADILPARLRNILPVTTGAEYLMRCRPVLDAQAKCLPLNTFIFCLILFVLA